MPHPRCFSEHLGVPSPQLGNRHGLERCHILGDVHTFLLSCRTPNHQPSVNSEHGKNAHLKVGFGGIPQILGSERNLSKSAKTQPELPGFGWAAEVTDPALASSAMFALPLIYKPQD